MQIYSTKEIADIMGIHVNTVRFYEDAGFLTKPKRRKNGYRIYTQIQLEQCRLVRRAMKAEVMQNGLRKKAIEIVRLCAALDFNATLKAVEEYITMIDAEMKNARSAIKSVEDILNKKVSGEVMALKRQDAAKVLGVTPETLRTWERSGLIKVRRLQNGYRVYNDADMERLNIISTLRCANYSLSAILRLLNSLDRHETQSVEAILNTPHEGEEIISVCDRLILSLQKTAEDAKMLIQIVNQIKNTCSINQEVSELR